MTVAGQAENAHRDYGYELAEYTAGRRAFPPCWECASPIPDAPFTGREVCDDCEEEPGWWKP